ncbi:hypothetical protein OF83DRAFT_1101517 [Amylostereum chailletii]|nr:hypothetical protein OF83DRAFT_1101517 [Amylostereum chailletii]
MIRTLGRHGVVERTLSSQPRHVLINRVCVHRGLHLAASRYDHAFRPTVHYPRFARFLSDGPPSGADKTPTTPLTSTPPPLPSSRKSKVELRPGPVKPSPLTSSIPGASPKPVKVPGTPSGSASETTASNGGTKSSPSIVEMTKQDMHHARTHGVLAPPPPNAGRIGKLWHQVKELFKFYLRGIKLINTHRVQVREMRERVKAGGEPLSRWESRFIQTYQQDLVKLVPFLTILLVLEEVIPLIVLYAPGMLPSTCVLPSQRERIEQKRRDKQEAFIQSSREELSAIQKAGVNLNVAALPSRTHMMAICGALSLSTWGPPHLRIRRVERHLQGIAADDALLTSEGMGERLTQPELIEALEERGIMTTELSSSTLKARLRWWLSNVDKSADGDAVSRRIFLVARSGLGQFQ